MMPGTSGKIFDQLFTCKDYIINEMKLLFFVCGEGL